MGRGFVYIITLASMAFLSLPVLGGGGALGRKEER